MKSTLKGQENPLKPNAFQNTAHVERTQCGLEFFKEVAKIPKLIGIFWLKFAAFQQGRLGCNIVLLRMAKQIIVVLVRRW